MVRPFLDHPTPFGMAHQGGTDVAPGNTEASFEHAVSLGYRYIETDVHATSDGVLVVFHDDDLEAATGAAGRIEDLTWEEVSELRVAGTHRLPRLDQMVERFPGTYFNVEPKGDSAVAPLIDLIRSRDLHRRLCIGSFSDSRVAQVRAAFGSEVCTSPGPKGVALTLLMAVVWPRGKPRHPALQVPTRYWFIPLTGRWLVRRLHRLGVQVHVWTINDEVEMHRLLDNGVDAIMSDRISLLRDVLRQRGHWPEEDQ